ncbi:MAG TPA: hypothetical protein VE956_20085 [Nodularia sp. (in: cyanobacteria)]|nr:hypothetical protein [Nodularia sp. (in: cyanobacteria)]
MTLFCKIGDTARVTFPDGEILEYQNTPVDIIINENRHTYRVYSALEFWYDSAKGGYKAGEGSGFSNISEYPSEIGQLYFKNSTNGVGNSRPYGVYINSYLYPNSSARSEIFIRGYQSPNDPYFVKPWTIYQNGTQWFEILPYVGNVQTFQPSYVISVFDRNGALLKQKTYTSNKVLVSCITPCPPGTLDCGDCCLNCDAVNSSLSAMIDQVEALA